MKGLLRITATLIVATVGPAVYGLNQIPRDSEVKYGVLPNGLTYYIRHNEKPAGEADFFLVQNTGSVNEEENQRGLAHFLEHLCFNGTRHFPGKSMISYLESLGVKFGANLNAYTSTDETVYNICEVPAVRTGTVDSCLLILRDWSGDINIDRKTIDEERGVIKGEYRQRYSGANNRLLEKTAQDIYGNSIYGRRMPIGLMSVVENFEPSELAEYYHKWYHPGNQCVIVVGDVDVALVESRIERLWKKYPKRKSHTLSRLPEVKSNRGIRVVTGVDREQMTPMVQLWLKHDGVSDEEKNTISWLRFDAVRSLVCDMLVGRFNAREEKADVPYSNLGIGDRKFLLSRGKQALMLRANAFPGRVEDVVTVLSEELKRAADRGFLESELTRAKIDLNATVDNRMSNRESVSNTEYAREYVDNFLNGGPLPSRKAWCRMMKGVVGRITVNDVNDYIRSVVADSGDDAVLVAYLPEGEKSDSSRLAAAYNDVDAKEIADYVDGYTERLVLESLPQEGTIVKEEKNETLNTTVLTLSNGVKVQYRQSDEKKDQILIRGCSEGGFSAKYDAGKGPLYQIVNDVLAVSGYGPFTSAGLRKLLAGRNVKTSVFVGNVDETVEVSTTPADFETAMQVMYLKLTQGRKDSVAFRNLIESRRAKLKSQNNNPTFMMGDSIHAYVYRRHPFGSKLNTANIDSVSYDDVMDIYHDRFGDMSDFTFYVSGNFDVDTLRRYACRYLASLPGGGRDDNARDTGYGYAEGRARHNFFCRMTEPQSICYTFYNAPSEYSLRNVVLGSFVGQILRSRLMDDLREQRGWTYSVKSHAGISAGMNGGNEAQVIMPVYIRVAPEHADAVFDIVGATVDAMADEKNITTDEIDKVKKYLLKSYNSGREDNAYWLSVMRAFDRFGVDMHSNYQNVVSGVTARDIAGFVKNHFVESNRIQLCMSPQS